MSASTVRLTRMPHLSATTSRRLALLIAAAAATALGLILHLQVLGHFANLASDALYTVLVYLVLAFILPRGPKHWLAFAAFAISSAIELAQLTGVPAQLAASFPPSRLIFGTTFAAWDLLAYAVGSVAVWAVDCTVSAGMLRWRAPQPE